MSLTKPMTDALRTRVAMSISRHHTTVGQAANRPAGGCRSRSPRFRPRPQTPGARSLHLTTAVAIALLTLSSAFACADDATYRTALAAAVRATANRVLPSIVTIEIVGTGGPVRGEVEQDAPTSGVIVDEAGHILASSIVVQRPSASILVVLPNGQRHSAKVIARDTHRDLVLLKIKTDQPLTPIQWAGNPDLPIGATTVAVGRYGGAAAPIVSRGVLSARERLDGIALQTDARVSPAFYGGPLVDLYGNVLGILIPAVAQGGAPDATSWYDSGIAFAIPSEVIATKIERLKSGQEIKRGLIGIVAKTRDPIAAGTEIAAVRTRSPAEAAGIQAGDQVISINGRLVHRHQEIRQVLGSFDAGETIGLTLRRDGREIDVELKLADTIPPLQPQHLGLIASDRDVGEGDQASTEVVVDAVIPDTPAATELNIGDVVQKIGQVDIRDIDSLRRQLITAEPDTPLAIEVLRDGQSLQRSVTPVDIAGPFQGSLPKLWSAPDSTDWQAQEIKLPDAANAAAYLAPVGETEADRLGLMVVLIGPGQSTPLETLGSWTQVARSAGVVVCAVAPEDTQRWQPKELDTVAKFAAAVMKQAPIDSTAVAVATAGALADGEATAADSMALAVAISQSKTFFGVAVSSETRPPAIRLRENEPATSLQLMLPVETPDDLPGWATGIRKSGYPIVLGGELDEITLLHWVRLLQSI